MRHLLLDHWSRGSSRVHKLGAKTKLTALLVALVSLSLATPFLLPVAGIFLIVAIRVAALPLPALMARAVWVVPFSAAIALSAWFSGDLIRATSLLAKSYLSALAALLFAATTPLPVWTAALRSWGLPAALVSTIEFVYRYLFVLAEEAQTICTAARARGGFRFSAAGGALGVLFARSWQRAENVHHAMLARGYRGSRS